MWTKICGITNLANAQQVATAGPDAIGLNFYRGSKRCVDVAVAAEIVATLPARILPVGLFVNHSLEEIDSITKRCGLTTIQLHGDETPEFVQQLSKFNIIRAFRVGDSGLEAVAKDLQRYQELGVSLFAALIDAQSTHGYGGTGEVAPWERLAKAWQSDWPRLILAGGLTAENVREAIQTVQPWGVDVASGVEISPGEKDSALVQRFLHDATIADN